jgi:hypothetical protein
VPDLSHLWQRFLLAASLVVGLLIGAASTVFGYSNLQTVNLHWSVFHINGVPLWAVAVVPIALILVAGTLYHWADGLHHFTEHHRHRRRVHELEVEIATLKAHLDQVLEMPGRGEPSLAARPSGRTTAKAALPPADFTDTDLEMSELESVDSEPKPLGPKVAEPKAATTTEPEAEPAEAETKVSAAKSPRERRKKPRAVSESKAAAKAETDAGHPNGADSKPASAPQ